MSKSATVTGMEHGLKPGDILVMKCEVQGWKKLLPWSKEKWKVECVHGGTVGCTKVWNGWSAVKALLNPGEWELAVSPVSSLITEVRTLIHKDSGVIYNSDMNVSFRNPVSRKAEYEFSNLVYIIARLSSEWLWRSVRDDAIQKYIENWDYHEGC